ncbi:GMC oxidoreductase-domain-containing protein [Boletus reticuloceps]|uniref:GMC oxidoreductase-domain-containing protein n=1 Tax=Boletus reticuloceps TaxID=495285 RepID=A0A8I2YJR6_9AGAM|nr:GMC oxidoreductase-domain-containing protein [Boletus reticuloceps]
MELALPLYFRSPGTLDNAHTIRGPAISVTDPRKPSMPTQCLDPTFFISDRDSTGGEKSTLSTLSSIPYHPAEQGIAQTREEIESTLKGHGVLIDSSLSFEYIIVGGGTAGLVVASRLAESLGPGQYVCVVEAGTYRQDPLVDVPGAFGMSNMNQDYDWSYETVPQENLHDRRIASSAGRLLGGSSGINFLVRMRASGPEYDAWNAFGNGWDWQGLLPYFKAEERYEGYVLGTDQIFPGITKKEDEEARLKEPEFRGHSGPVHSTHNNIYTDLLQPTIETTLKFGIKTNRIPGYGVSTGMFNIDIAVNRQQGTRSYAANAYLRDPESIVPQSNVVVLKHVYATKILFDSHASGQGAKAVGLACLGGVDWKSPSPVNSLPAFELKVNKEIIVSTGTFNTPRLLELSGIGNPEILSKFNITPIVRLPTVGENLQEHPVVISDFVVKDGVFTLDKLRVDPKYRAEQANEYYEKRTGAYATTVSAYGFFKLKNFLTEKEVEELRTELDKEILRASNGFYKKQLAIQRRFLDDDDVGDVELIMVPRVFASDPKDNTSYISFVVLLPHPVARGSVHISSSEPLAPPSIDPQYLNNLHDTKILTKAMQFVRKLSETAPLKDIIVAPSTPGPEVQTEAQFEEFVRNHLKSSGHPIGTAAMAPQPLGGVVDENLRIYGTQNVRVVDMSIAPLHLAAHLLDTAYAIGEKASECLSVRL